MKDKEIDDILKRAAQSQPDVNQALLARIASSIGESLHPVRPLPPTWVLASGMAVICAGVGSFGAAVLGFHGIQEMTVADRWLIFPSLCLLTTLAAITYAGEKIPGSRRRVSPESLLWGGSLALIAIFIFLFRDYRTDNYMSQGFTCLKAGLLHAIPTAIAGWLLTRRGFAVNATASGLAAGTLAGLAGVSMLELHCPNFEVLHVTVWHTAVMVVSGCVGALLARLRA